MNIRKNFHAVQAGDVLAESGATVLRSFPVNGKGDWRLILDNGNWMTRGYSATIEVFVHPSLPLEV